ncbi:transporter substrate-binding domain-containing protein [Myxococcus sp. Y35]|uniref:transporter substrate-binding domain-containing protein n=1 Tax=Pseudomyxococcus flavus TaxID=3115648 RepID=UPI003CF10A09
MRGERGVGVLLVGWLVLATGACGLPRDTHGTQARIQQEGLLRVGLVRHAPWTELLDGKPTGPEAQAVAQLAEQLGARVAWTVAPEAELMHALKERAVDLVIGGIPAKAPWAKQLGTGHPYLTTQVRVGAPPGQSVPETLEGLTVFVARGSDAGPRLQEEGAHVRETDALHEAPGFRAAWDWQLAAWGYVPGGAPLREEQRMWVVPAGENRWLLTVDRFVVEHAQDIRQGLIAAAQSRASRASAEGRR